MNYCVKALTAIEPGRLVMRTIRTFLTAGEADRWLCEYVTRNRLDIRDFTISRNPADVQRS